MAQINPTPKRLAAIYEMLLLFLPFSRWGLPPARNIQFRLVSNTTYDGYYSFNKHRKMPHTIGIAAYDTFSALISVMAHEMVHLKEQIDGHVSGCAGENYHSKEWRRLAALVCRKLGFESRGF